MLKKEKFKPFGMSITLFLLITAIVLLAIFLEVLPVGMIGALPAMIVIGIILNELGNRLPIVKTYLGGGPIVIIFASAALVMFNILPKSTTEIITNFMKTESFLDFYIAALITGSILGMDRNLLVKAAIRYLPVIVGGVLVAFGLTGITGILLGYGFKESILYISLPIMGGGMGAGAVPLAEIFSNTLQTDVQSIMSKMVPAVALGNALAIVAAGILNRIGKGNDKLSGDGRLMRTQEMEVDEEKEEELKLGNLGRGLLMATTFFIIGQLLSYFLKDIIDIHPYAMMIITVALVKAFGFMPKEYEVAAHQWYNFIMTNFTSALLVGIGIAYTDLSQVVDAFSIQYLLLVGMTVIGSILGAGLVGQILGFFPIEAAITGGLCMANMGGTGDVAVLSAADRMELMPFAQISSRIGGAFILLLATALLGIIG